MAMTIGGSDVETILLPAIVAAGGGDIAVPVGLSTGFFNINPNGLAAALKYCRFVGQGWGSVLQYAGGGGPTSFVVGSSGTKQALEVTFKDLVIDCNSVAAFGVSLGGWLADIFTFERVWFKNFTGVGFLGTQVRKSRFRQCKFSRPGDSVGIGIELVDSTYDPDIVGCSFEWVNLGVLIDSGVAGEVPSARAFYDGGNRIEQGYWLIKPYPNANATGAGATVTYQVQRLTDSTKNFTLIPPPSGGVRTIRLMPVLRAATTTNVGQTILADATADFRTYGIGRGDIVRTAASWAVVQATDAGDGTRLYIEGWRDNTTYEETTSPAIGTAYTVYGIYIGDIVVTLSATQIAVERWRDLRGNTVVPVDTTRYEILGEPTAGGIHFEAGVTRSIIGRSFHMRGWSDLDTSRGELCITTSMICMDGQDTGQTKQGAGSIVANNIDVGNGAQGMAVVLTEKVLVLGNVCKDNGTEYIAAPLSCDIATFDATDCMFVNNLLIRTEAQGGYYGMSLRSVTSGLYLADNMLFGHTIAPFLIEQTLVQPRVWRHAVGNEYSLPVPADNGDGAWVDVSQMGLLKTIVVGGTLIGTINIDISNEDTPTKGAPVVTFPGPDGNVTVLNAAHWLRARVSGFKRGSSVAKIQAESGGLSFLELVATADNGSGPAVDVSAMGPIKTVTVGDTFRGTLLVEASVDGVQWAQVMFFPTTGAQTLTFFATFLRVTRTGVPDIAPGLPIVNVGSIAPTGDT